MPSTGCCSRQQFSSRWPSSTTHERTVSLRFGLDDSPPHTLEEVGRLFGVTRERIRQIEATALGERRQPRFGTLRGYLEGS